MRNVTQSGTFGLNNLARPGDTLEYRVAFANNGDGPISGLKINDMTPAHTSFVGADAQATPASLGGCAKRTPANVLPSPEVSCAASQTAGGTGAIEWSFPGVLDPGGTGTVVFRVRID